MSNINKAQVNGTNRTKSTISFWLKRGTLGADQKVFSFVHGGAEYLMKFKSNDQINIYDYNGSSYVGRIETNQVFRDPSAWYHFHIQVDTTDATAGNRFRFYVNGEQVTSLLNSNTPSQNDNFELSTSNHHLYIGSQSDGGDAFSGSFAHFHYTDGYSYAPTVFGSTDSTSGIWKPNTAPSVTYGTNGFFLKFENSGNLDLDSSGNNLTFTTTGTITQNVDTPSKNFATLNPLQPNMSGVPSNGNLTYVNPSSGQRHIPSTLAVSSGKWYVEVKCNVVGGDYPQVGVFNTDITFDTATYIGSTANGYGLSSTGHIWNSNSQQVNTGTTWTTGDIIGVALDLTNDKIYWHKNGTYVSNGTGTGNPSTGTNGYSITADKTWYFTNSSNGAGGSPSFSFNFGSGYFGTTQVSSSNADANGLGLMEYAVPTGFYTLNTENIKEFG